MEPLIKKVLTPRMKRNRLKICLDNKIINLSCKLCKRLKSQEPFKITKINFLQSVDLTEEIERIQVRVGSLCPQFLNRPKMRKTKNYSSLRSTPFFKTSISQRLLRQKIPAKSLHLQSQSPFFNLQWRRKGL